MEDLVKVMKVILKQLVDINEKLDKLVDSDFSHSTSDIYDRIDDIADLLEEHFR